MLFAFYNILSKRKGDFVMKKKNFGLKLLLSCMLSFGMVGCDDDNNQQPNAVVPQNDMSTFSGGEIKVYGNVDKTKFKELTLSNGKKLLAVDDGTVNSNYAGMGLNLLNVEPTSGKKTVNVQNYSSSVESSQDKSIKPSETLQTKADEYLKKVKEILEKEGATVNLLVNQVAVNAQSPVVQITLDVKFNNQQKSASELRNLIATILNNSKLPQGMMASSLEYGDKLRVNLSFWQDKEKIFLWLGSYLEKDSEVIKKKYFDLNSATALTSNRVYTTHNKQEQFTQSQANAGGVDILWSVDASGSMSEEQTNLANGAEQFFNTLNKAGIDYRLAVNTHGYSCTSLRQTSTGKNFIDKNTVNALTEWRNLARPGVNDSSTETGFYCVREANLSGFDRPQAKNLVVFVSDEPENETFNRSQPAEARGKNYTVRDFENYQQFFTKTGATYFAITGTSSFIRPNFNAPIGTDKDFSCYGQGGSASGGAHFKEIARLTGGSSASICADSADWSVMFEQILKTATGLASNFKLQYIPLPSTVVVKVNGKEVKRDISHQDGFDLVYSKEGVSLVFYGNSLPKQNDAIQVKYAHFSTNVQP